MDINSLRIEKFALVQSLYAYAECAQSALPYFLCIIVNPHDATAVESEIDLKPGSPRLQLP